jgi:hypothetical protein
MTAGRLGTPPQPAGRAPQPAGRAQVMTAGGPR